jgi:serine/threonine protein kinase
LKISAAFLLIVSIGLEKTDTLWILKLASNIARAIGVIHAQGIIHKNINPSNIVFNPHNERINIIDFDLSTELTRELPALKNPDISMQSCLTFLRSRPAVTNRAIDYRTDMYSFGITLYQMLTGKLPFSGSDTLEILHAHIAGTPVSPKKIRPGLSWAIALIIEKLMAKNPEDRYQSMQGLISDLSVCIMEMEKKGEIEPFHLAERIFPKNFIFPKTLWPKK